ncbi:DUF5667 domain-containing protein [Streptacidiphilus sp. EB129]|uniref:DUF5667 domain-containing protein n=1 Tax=Streptacidiphilus sp. EB129 TaxID=3156262 RepID=UPI0035114E9C
MTANVLEHRRARAFADAVEDRPSTAAPSGPGEHRGEFRGEFGALLALVDALAEEPLPALDPQVRMTQRALLVAEFERAFAGGGGAAVPGQRSRGAHRATEAARRFRPSTRWGRRLAVSGLAAGVAMGALGGVAAASSSAVPGDSLYGMKRGLENWQLDLAGSDAERGRLLLDQASHRMSEAEELTSRPQNGQALSPHVLAEVAQALTDMNAEGSAGRDLLKAIYQQDHALAPMQRLARFAETQQQQLRAIEPRLDGQLAPVTSEVQNLLAGINADLAPLHLAPAPGSADTGAPQPGGSDGGGTDAGTGTGAATAGQTAGTAPQGATTSGTGTLRNSSPGASPSTTSGSGGLVGSLTGGLLGNGAPTTSPSATAPGGAGATGGEAASPTPGNGVSIPPLLPGLLPGIGLGVSGGS